jgi:hypothetical protein
LIEEKDKIFRTEVWASPPRAPATAENPAAKIRGFNKLFFTSKQFRSRVEGATFCQAKTINEFIQERPSTTWGSQRWNGAAPIFISNLKKIRKEATEKLERPCCKVAANSAVDRRIEEANA